MKDEGRRQKMNRGWMTVLVVSLILQGCRDSSSRTVDGDVPELSFSQQAELVREGQGDQIRLDQTRVDDEDLRALDGLEEKLRRINLSHSEITDAGLARIARLPKLIQLRLASDKITDAGLAVLADLKELRHLHLIDAPITDAGLAQLQALKDLESLYLDGTRASDEGKKRLVEALPGVHLHFDGGHFRDDPHADDHEH